MSQDKVTIVFTPEEVQTLTMALGALMAITGTVNGKVICDPEHCRYFLTLANKLGCTYTLPDTVSRTEITAD